MPWNERNGSDERLKFVAGPFEAEKMACSAARSGPQAQSHWTWHSKDRPGDKTSRATQGGRSCSFRLRVAGAMLRTWFNSAHYVAIRTCWLLTQIELHQILADGDWTFKLLRDLHLQLGGDGGGNHVSRR